MKLTVSAKNAGQRIDKFLQESLNGFSRSQIQKLIKSGEVRANEKPINKGYAVKEGDAVAVALQPKKSPPEATINPRIIADEHDFLVIEKPAGLLVHATSKKEAHTLADWLKKKYPQIIGVGEEPDRPGIVHRLDKEVSGIMIVAKNQRFYHHLKKQFQDKKVEKNYFAVVFGGPSKDEICVSFPLSRSRLTGRISAHAKGTPGKEAITEIDVVQRYKNHSLLAIRPKTGRTNQIRVHLKAIGHPIVGDKLYKINKYHEKGELSRVLLHANKICFTDLSGASQRYSSVLPKIFNEFISTINGSKKK